jgi:hypothetical protein
VFTDRKTLRTIQRLLWSTTAIPLRLFRDIWETKHIAKLGEERHRFGAALKIRRLDKYLSNKRFPATSLVGGCWKLVVEKLVLRSGRPPIVEFARAAYWRPRGVLDLALAE